MAKQRPQAQDKRSQDLVTTSPTHKVPRRLNRPKGALKAQSAHFTKRLAEARAAGEHMRVLGFADDPIKEFNDLHDSVKELVIKDLILGFGKYLHTGGADLAPADMQYYSMTGLPAAERALLRGKKLVKGDGDEDETEDENEEKDMEVAGEREIDDDDEMIHGKARWPPVCVDGFVGKCSRPIRMDETGRVNLQHDAYCLREHFTTRWGVLVDQTQSGAPQRGSTIEWNDESLCFVTEGEDSRLQVKLRRWDDEDDGRTALFQLIGSPMLQYRIMANFGAAPYTEVNGYKCTWSYTFWNRDDPTCCLKIKEFKGGPRAFFNGGKKASTEALQLLEWLTGGNCPHPYDYTPCGLSA